jgi:hypothetical protein
MFSRRGFVAAVLAGFVFFPLAIAQLPQYGDEVYRPSVGQAGKDVVWVPTPDAMVTRMLQAAKTTDKDYVIDLGAGDGKIAIAAAKQFGARSMGIEYNPDMAALAKRNAERAGVADKVTIIQGDVFKEDFSKANVLTMYLLPDLNLKLRPTILGMKPGTRVVTHQFHMGDWGPDEVLEADGRTGYLWIVPAKVDGTWTLREEGGPFEAKVTIRQLYQQVGGTATVGTATQQLVGTGVKGDQLWFTLLDRDGQVRSFKGTVNGDRISGGLFWPTGGSVKVSGTRG